MQLTITGRSGVRDLRASFILAGRDTIRSEAGSYRCTNGLALRKI